MTSPTQAHTTPNGRIYVHAPVENPGPDCVTGGLFPSVTRVKSQRAMPALPNWHGKRAATFAVDNLDLIRGLDRDSAIALISGEPRRYTSAAAERGSAVHAAIERVLLDEYHEEAGDVAPYLAAFKRFLAAFDPVVAFSEATVFSHRHGFAGTLDLVADVEGHGRLLVDMKTGASGPWPDVSLQLAAYRCADEVITGPPWRRHRMPVTDGAAVLKLRPDYFELIPVETGPDVMRAFLACLQLHRFQEHVEPGVIGLPLSPRKPATR